MISRGCIERFHKGNSFPDCFSLSWYQCSLFCSLLSLDLISAFLQHFISIVFYYTFISMRSDIRFSLALIALFSSCAVAGPIDSDHEG
jgi:hypothetical protein